MYFRTFCTTANNQMVHYKVWEDLEPFCLVNKNPKLHDNTATFMILFKLYLKINYLKNLS